MPFQGDILFLDLARICGWCEGPVHGPLRYGTRILAPEGSGEDAIFAGCIDFMVQRFSAFKPRVVAYEAPLDPRHLKKTTKETIERQIGFPAIVKGLAYKFGIYDTRFVEVRDIKEYWLGRSNIKSDMSKRMIRDKLRGLGYSPDTLDASDAIAGHRYVSAGIDPTLRIEPLTLLRERL